MPFATLLNSVPQRKLEDSQLFIVDSATQPRMKNSCCTKLSQLSGASEVFDTIPESETLLVSVSVFPSFVLSVCLLFLSLPPSFSIYIYEMFSPRRVLKNCTFGFAKARCYR